MGWTFLSYKVNKCHTQHLFLKKGLLLIDLKGLLQDEKADVVGKGVVIVLLVLNDASNSNPLKKIQVQLFIGPFSYSMFQKDNHSGKYLG